MLRSRKWKWTSLLAVLIAGSQLLFGCQKQEMQQETATAPSQEQLQQAELLNKTADDLYSKAMNGDLDGGRVLLIQLGDQVTGMRFEGMTSVEGVGALTDTITDAKRVFNSTEGNVSKAQAASAKIRLAADALTHKHQPLWLQYYRPMQEGVDLLERAASETNKEVLQQGAGRLTNDYDLIRPSVIISQASEDVEKMDSLLTFVKNQAGSAHEPYHNIRNVILPLRQTIDKLFMKKETTAYLPSIEQQHPIMWTLTFASIIITALGFAAWRLSRKDGITPVRGPEEIGS